MFLLDRVSCPDTEIQVLRTKKNWVPTSYLQEGYKIRRWVFCPTSRSIQGKRSIFFANELHTRASTGKPRKPLSPPGLVYCHKKRAWESWEKKRKRPRKARRWLQQRQCSICPKPRILFFCSRLLGVQKPPILVEYRLLCFFQRGSHAQRKFRKRTTLRSKRGTLKGLLYAPIQKKQYHKRTTLHRLKILLRSICSKEGPHYCLGAKRKEAVIRQAINAIWHWYIKNPAAKHS